MTAFLQALMRYKISECYCVAEYHEYINESPKLKKNAENQIHFIQKLLKN